MQILHLKFAMIIVIKQFIYRLLGGILKAIKRIIKLVDKIKAGKSKQ